jgi:hypothetical protein
MQTDMQTDTYADRYICIQIHMQTDAYADRQRKTARDTRAQGMTE